MEIFFTNKDKVAGGLLPNRKAVKAAGFMLSYFGSEFSNQLREDVVVSAMDQGTRDEVLARVRKDQKVVAPEVVVALLDLCSRDYGNSGENQLATEKAGELFGIEAEPEALV